MDGSVVALGASPDGGECGVWVDRDGRHLVEVNQLYHAAGSLDTMPL
jgi:hypothetical protein